MNKSRKVRFILIIAAVLALSTITISLSMYSEKYSGAKAYIDKAIVMNNTFAKTVQNSKDLAIIKSALREFVDSKKVLQVQFKELVVNMPELGYNNPPEPLSTMYQQFLKSEQEIELAFSQLNELINTDIEIRNLIIELSKIN